MGRPRDICQRYRARIHCYRDEPSIDGDADRAKSILGGIPADRWGVPDDFRGPVVFLACEASRYVFGEILTVDGRLDRTLGWG